MSYLSRQNAYRLGKLILLGMAVQLIVIVYVFYQSYKGRSDLIHTQRAGCERGKLDRQANAVGWRIAEAARIASGDQAVAAKYNVLATSLEKRGRINCSAEYPKARLLP